MKLKFTAAVAVSTALLVSTPSFAADSLAQFTGNWTGGGKIIVNNGSNERIRCRATNSSKGNALSLNIRCASDSYKFELTSDITDDGAGNLSGSWNESTHNVFGQLSGRVSGPMIQATASAIGFTATLTIRSTGNGQTVSMKASPGQEIQEVQISFNRGR